MKKIIVILLCLLSQISVAQFSGNYIPVPVQDTIPDFLFKQLKEKNTKEKSSTAELKPKLKSFINSLYDDRIEHLVKLYNDDYFIIDSILTPYLQSVLDQIYKANPDIPQEAKVYAYRSETPNAMSFGEGTIAFTLGLLSRLENEDQLAFVLCHELAHYHNRHSDSSIKKYAQLNFDKDLNKQAKDIQRSTYGRYTKMKELMKNVVFSYTYHSRESELEADSVGLNYFFNTSYNQYASVRVMEILDSADMEVSKDNVNFEKHFNFKEYPYKVAWSNYTKSTDFLYTSEKPEESDSLKTHPACKIRREILQKRLGGTPTNNTVNKTNFSYYKALAQFEVTETLYHFKNYGRAMFNAMLLQEEYPENGYLYGVVAKCLFQLYVHQKNHELGKVLELPDARFEENYDRFLSFIHNLRLAELESLTYYYSTSQKDSFYSNEDLFYSLWLTSHLSKSDLNSDKIKEDYFKKFPSGRYKNSFKNISLTIKK